MKKIGIATYIKNYNYGTVLQSYALKEYIKNLGYIAEIIDFTDMSLLHNKKMKIITYLNSFSCLICNPLLLKNEMKRRNTVNNDLNKTLENKKELFNNFEQAYLKYNKENYFDSKNFDGFICGSDQVWKLTIPGLHSFFFLRFANASKRIAYAPSFGGNVLPKYNKKRLKKYLEGFKYLSVREKSGADIIKQITNMSVPQVLDPVLLVGKNFWENRIKQENKCKKTKSYILCYFLDQNKLGEEITQKIAKEKNLNIICIDNGKDEKSNRNFIVPDPLEYVNLINDADYVITDSFHGTAFSIMMNTNFYVVPREYLVSKDQQTRINSILELTNLENRLIKSINSLNYNSIDFNYANKVLSTEQYKSSDYLKNALVNVINNS